MDSCGAGSVLDCRQKPEGSCPWLFLGFCVLMALDRFLLGQEFEQKWWSYLYSQICPHSWETSSIPAVFGYGALWHRISSGCQWRVEFSCPRQPLGSCVLKVLGRFLRVAVLVLPALTGLSTLLGGSFPPSAIWVWRPVLQEICEGFPQHCIIFMNVVGLCLGTVTLF